MKPRSRKSRVISSSIRLNRVALKTRSREPRVTRSPIGLLVVGALLIALPLLCCGFVQLLFESSEDAAYALLPPIHSDSTMTGQWRSGGTATKWDRRTYTTSATPQEVIDYYRQHFDAAEYSVQAERHFFNKCDRSAPAQRVARWINEGRYPFYTADNVPLPCVSISIDTHDQQPNNTKYSVDIEWPAP